MVPSAFILQPSASPPPADRRCGASKDQHTLLAYDRAASDCQYTNKLKPTKSSYLISRWQDNLTPVTTSAQPMARTNLAKALIISDETVTFQDTPAPGAS